jgi:hypothetical protein
MRRGRIAVALFFASAIFAQGSSSVADVSALPGHILFTRAGGIFGDETLYVANADGTG